MKFKKFNYANDFKKLKPGFYLILIVHSADFSGISTDEDKTWSIHTVTVTENVMYLNLPNGDFCPIIGSDTRKSIVGILDFPQNIETFESEF